MAITALQAIAIKAFRDRLASLGVNPLEVIETASLRRGAALAHTRHPLRMKSSKQRWPCPAIRH